ncbi:MAG: hypothetical protein ACM3JI_04945 [Anaerolineae bacterium]
MTTKRTDSIIEVDFSPTKTVWIEWLVIHGRALALSLAAVMLTVFFIVVYLTYFRYEKQDFLGVGLVYQKWAATNPSDEKLLGELNELLEKNADLKVKYFPLIGSRLIALNDGTAAEPYFRQIKETTFQRGHYEKFAMTSLLISKGDLLAALEEAKELKKNLEEDEAFWGNQNRHVRFGSILFAFNLLRIAILEKEVGSPQGELSAWAELQKHAGWLEESSDGSKYCDSESVELLQNNFTQQGATLLDYIQDRRKALGDS